MNLSFNARAAAAFALAALCATAVACADSAEEPDLADFEDNDAGDTTDASTEPPPSKDETDAGLDATPPDDAGDAGPKRVCTIHGWCHTQLPADKTLRGVWGDGTGIVWTVSEEGDILRWDGTSWSIVHTGAGKLLTIWGSSPTDIWVGGTNGLLHGTGATSATVSWTQLATDGDVPVLSIWGTSANDVWAVGNDGSTSRVLHYDGAPSAPPASGWSVHPVSASVVGQLVKVWGYGTTDVWIAGSRSIGWGDDPVIWHLSPDDGGAPTFQKYESLDYYASNMPSGGLTSDPNDVIWYGTFYGSSYMLRGTRNDSTEPFEWTDLLAWNVPKSHWTCGNLVHHGALTFAMNDVWTYGEYGRLCHFNGTRWDLAAVSIEELPFTNDFWDAWAPNGDASQMWVVGKNVAIRKQAPVKP
ncbi:MAG: hypothetical protein KF764_18955 [Labilithrix sp.]|nr:hypothetical protein [Labilithrix sp.]